MRKLIENRTILILLLIIIQLFTVIGRKKSDV